MGQTKPPVRTGVGLFRSTIMHKWCPLRTAPAKQRSKRPITYKLSVSYTTLQKGQFRLGGSRRWHSYRGVDWL